MNPLLAEDLDTIIAEMTPAEKLAQLGGIFPFRFFGDDGAVDSRKMKELIPHGIGQISVAAMLGGNDPAHMAGQANAIQRFHVEETRLGIPAILHNEALNGLQYAAATPFPTAINLAATWEPDLIRQMTDLTRRQMRAVGIHQALSPVLDVARDARWGRVHETYGEDPVLCAAFGTAFVEGLQGDDLREGAIATGKHFLGYAWSEAALNQAAVHLGPRALYEVFALPFEAAIREAGLRSVMNSYSEIDGVPVAAAREVLTSLLRAELGFEGFVVADYGSVGFNLTKHQVADDERDAALQSLVAGLDVELPELHCFRELQSELENGELDASVVDEAVARVLDAKRDLGLFEHPFCAEDNAATVYSLPEATDLARSVTERSLVLIDNDGTLPLAADGKRIAVVGPFADSLRLMFAAYSAAAGDELNRYLAAGISGSMEGIEIDGLDSDSVGAVIFGSRDRALPDEQIEAGVRAMYPEMPTLLEALRTSAPDVDFGLATACHFLDRDGGALDEAANLAADSDVVVCAVGEKTGWVGQATAGEGRDASDLRLPGLQSQLVERLIATGKPVVLVLFSGRPLVLPDGAAAVLWSGAPGRYGPAAVAAALLGHIEPSGRLPFSFPRATGQVPIYAAHKVGSGSSRRQDPGHVDSANGPRYPLGHGCGFGELVLGDLSLSHQVALYDETVQVSCTARNASSERATSGVVQLYVHDRQASVTRPIRQLAGFVKVDIPAGQTRRVDFHLAISQLALLDRAYRLVVEPGMVDVMIGRSADQIDLSGEIFIDGDVTELECRGPFFADADVS